MASILCIIILHQFIQTASTLSFLPEARQIVFDRFDGACAGKHLPMLATNVITNYNNSIIYINSTMTIKENLGDKIKLNLNIFRCRSKENLDTCENFIQHTGLNYCQLIDPRAGHMSPVYLDYTPEYKCPLTKGVYRAYNTKIDTSAIAIFPLGTYYWRTKVEIFDGVTKRHLQCFQCDSHGVVKAH